MSKYSIFFLNLPNIQGLFDQLNVVADIDAEVIHEYTKVTNNYTYDNQVNSMMEDSEYLFREAIEQYITKTEQLKQHENYPEIVTDFRLWLHFMAHRKLSRLKKIQQITEQMIVKRNEEYQRQIALYRRSNEYYKSKRNKTVQPIVRPPGYRRQKKSERQILREQLEEYKLLTTQRARGGLYDYEMKDYELTLPDGPFFYEAVQRFQNKYVCFNTGTCVLKEFGQNRTSVQLKCNRYYDESPKTGKGITRLYYCSCQSSYRLSAITIIIQLSITRVKQNTTTKDTTSDDTNTNENNENSNANNNENSNYENNENTNDHKTSNDENNCATTSTVGRSDDTKSLYLCKIFVKRRYCEQVQSHFQLNPNLKYGPDGIEILQQRHEQLPKRKVPQHILERRKKKLKEQQQQSRQSGDGKDNEKGKDEQQHQDNDYDNYDPNNDTDHYPYTTGDEDDDHGGEDENDDELEEDYVIKEDEEMVENDVFHHSNNNELQYY